MVMAMAVIEMLRCTNLIEIDQHVDVVGDSSDDMKDLRTVAMTVAMMRCGFERGRLAGHGGGHAGCDSEVC